MSLDTKKIKFDIITKEYWAGKNSNILLFKVPYNGNVTCKDNEPYEACVLLNKEFIGQGIFFQS